MRQSEFGPDTVKRTTLKTQYTNLLIEILKNRQGLRKKKRNKKNPPKDTST